MTILTIAFPVQAAIPVAETVIGSAASMARPALGLGALVAVLMMFKPLLLGLVRAAVLVVKPRQTAQQRAEQRAARRALRDAKKLHRMAAEVERLQPNLAAELRFLASRG
ncbi:hypothetical protein [Noviherbaspirillum massiliense]|uniref:hypothetical protein n=1 Tax=Noviherbaspirillum massiliense TaxID=1465823 RepID=UPI0002D44F7B|nr:hypothetical protein [Noviherbaspirillum massiliense]